MKTVGGEGVVAARGGFLWLILGMALFAPDVWAACNCGGGPTDFAWLVNSKIRYNNDAIIVGNTGANLPGGLVRFGRNSCQGMSEANPCIGNSVAVFGDRVVVGEGSSIAGSRSNRLKLGPGAVVRNPPLLNITLPLVAGPICGAFADITCGGPDVTVPSGGNAVIAPGSYGGLLVGNGATITMSAGTYDFCSVKIGSSVTGTVDEGTVLNVEGKFSMGSGTLMTTAGGPFVLNSEGSLVRLSQSAVLEAEVRAPNAKIKQQRAAFIRGCSCSESLTTDKHHGNVCEESGSPSGAFLD
jgi:hypothetical protein